MLSVSIVIPTHRRPALLAEAIESVLAQSAPDTDAVAADHETANHARAGAPTEGASVRAPTAGAMEILVVDDADDDATRACVTAAGARAAIPVRYLANPQPGVCHSRNLGARAAQGSHVAFLDDDDVWRSDFVVRMAAAIEATGADLAIAGLVRHERGVAPAPRVQRDDLDSQNVLDQPGSMTGSNFMIAHATFAAVGGFDPEMTVFNDWDLFVRLIDSHVSYVVVPEPLVEWREHGGERIATFSVRRARGLERFVAKYRRRLSAQLIRDHMATAFGIRRQHARSTIGRLYWSARLAIAHGPAESARRLIRR